MKVVIKTKCKECGKSSKQTFAISPDKAEYTKFICPHCGTKYNAITKISVELLKIEKQ